MTTNVRRYGPIWIDQWGCTIRIHDDTVTVQGHDVPLPDDVWTFDTGERYPVIIEVHHG